MKRVAVTVVSLALLATPLAATPAVAGDVVPPSGPPEVLAKGLLSPLSLAVAPRGSVWFSQDFAGQLMKIRPGGKPVVKYRTRRGAGVGAVSFRRGVVTFATVGEKGNTRLKKRTRRGRVLTVANLSRFERRNNPDQDSAYGFQGLPDDCEVPRFAQPYTGIVESNPYASDSQGRTTYVADAAGNTIVRVRDGRVRTVAVLPPQPVTVTPEQAEANGLPPCVAGHDFNFEPVPTDVEVHRGMLYVTTLPGGPEDPGLGNRAAVHRIDPATGALETLVTGLLSATGLAVSPTGDMYVAEMFRNRIAYIHSGDSTPYTWVGAKFPGDVEFRRGSVWATRKAVVGLFPGTGNRPGGQVVRYPVGIS